MALPHLHARTARKRRSNSSLWFLFGLPMLGFLAFPLAALLIAGSLPKALSQLGNPEAATAIWLSVKTTLLSTFLIGVLGTPLAYWISRGAGFWRRAIEVLSELPVALPPAAAGVALLIAFGRQGYMNLGVSFTALAVVLAQTFVAAPFYMRAAVGAFSDQPQELFDIAESDGASQWALYGRVAIPVAARSLVGGLVVAWARAAGEFGATMIFAGNYPGRTQTMPLAIYLGFEVNFNLALALSLVLMVVALIGFGLAQALMRGD